VTESQEQLKEFASAEERSGLVASSAADPAPTDLEAARAALAREIELRAKAEQRCTELSKASLQAREDEQRRIARDLHDQVGQTLTALKIAVTAGKKAVQQTEVAIARLGEAERACAELEQGLAEIAARLRPTALDNLGLRAAIEQHLSVWSERTGIEVEFETWELEHERFSEGVETALFRLVQEALTNIARHARATKVCVIVQCTSGHAVVSVEDDGVGFDPDDIPEGHFGIVGMRERLSLCQGTLEIESSRGVGSTVLARVPLEPGGDGQRQSD